MNIAILIREKFHQVKNIPMSWPKIINRCSTPIVLSITFAKYMELSPKAQTWWKNVGGFVGGAFRSDNRLKVDLIERSLITFDVDKCDMSIEAFWVHFKTVFPFTALIYSTCSHRPSAPRFRIVIPLLTPIPANDYDFVARAVAEQIGIQYFDTASFSAVQLMFWPAHCSDGVFFSDNHSGEWFDASGMTPPAPAHFVSDTLPSAPKHSNDLLLWNGKDRYVFDPYNNGKGRHTCPSCGEHKQYTCFVDSWGIRNFPYDVGRCNRENNCKYEYTPKAYFKDNPDIEAEWLLDKAPPVKRMPKPLPVYINKAALIKTIGARNNFIDFLRTRFTPADVDRAVRDYFIGGVDGKTVFWQVDEQRNIHAGKVMTYDPQTGHRGKQVKIKKHEHTIQCFFGQHLLPARPHKPVCIVESEKTAIIASIDMPDQIWIATGGKYGCKWSTFDVFRALIGRQVILYPDLGGYEVWKKRARILARAGITATVSDLLEKSATDTQRGQGWDIADYIILQINSSKIDT